MTVVNNAVPERDFTRARNDVIRERSLSLAAKGLYAYIASHAESYSLTMEQMIADSSDGRDAVRTVIRELLAHNLLARRPVRERGRIVRYDYELLAPVTTPGEPAAGQTVDGLTGDGPTVDGFPGGSRDQGKHDESAGRTDDWKAVDGEPPTKKTNPPNGGEKTKKTNTSSASPRGARLPEDWKPSTDLGAWMLSKLPEGRWSDHSRRWVLHETEKFTNHWHAAAGANARKLNWDRAWQNWMLRALERYRPAVAGIAPTSGAPAGQFKTAAEKNAEAAKRRSTIYQLADELMEQAGLDVDSAVAQATAEVEKRERKGIALDPCTVTGYIDGSAVDRNERREVES